MRGSRQKARQPRKVIIRRKGLCEIFFFKTEYLVPASFNALFAVRTPQLQKRTMIMRDKSTMPDNVLEYGMSTCLNFFDAMSAVELESRVMPP